MLGKTTYLCNFVKIKGKSIFPLRGAQINSNSVACVRDCRRVSERSGDMFEPESPPGRPNRKKDYE